MSNLILPDKPNSNDIKALRDEKGISIQEARAILIEEWKKDNRDALLMAVYDLRHGIGDPAEAEDTMLDILTELINRM